ncbi:glutamate dehydrogenase [Malonomonas rubra DSM 5091]|uniref:Glutamate dehydrogenase n=1 Tax=Malonomonas rubra DSM 5091 TaxID=1122189 RepID=A0A1M6B2N7_MALRU|nr:NAD-glutamate dehydrogenase domain-containing protein [Malonomonas rubra]SHI42927.1 glutamate dehydrogenase [Malonomonas rubra DSM 5091]
MKVTVMRGGRDAGEQNVTLQQTEIEQALIRHGQVDNTGLFATFGEILRQQVPANFLAGLSLEELVKNLLLAAEFVSNRTTDIKVEMYPLQNAGHYYLLANALDANHIFSSVQEFFHLRALNFRVICHPILSVSRVDGKLQKICEGDQSLEQESFIWLELELVPRRMVAELQKGVEKIIAAALKVSRARNKNVEKIAALAEIDNLRKFADLFDWLQDDNFVPVASRSFLYHQDTPEQIREVEEDALGLTRFYQQPFDGLSKPIPLRAPAVGSMHALGNDVALEKTELRCPLYRFERLSYLGFRQPLEDGNYREHSFWGFYTQKSIDVNTSSIPALRKRIEEAQRQLNIPHHSHNYRKTIQIINTFPKVELFLMGDDELRRMLRSFTQMHRQAGVKVVVAPSLSESDLTLLLTMPKEFYSADKITRLETYIKRYLRAGSVDSHLIHLSSDYLSLHVNLRMKQKEVTIDLQQLEQGLTRLTLPWELKFRALMEKSFGAESFDLWERFINAFDQEYRSRTHPRFAVRDVRNIEKLLHKQQDAFDLWGPFHDDDDYYRLQYYSLRESYLNELMPFMENLDLSVIEEVDFSCDVSGQRVFIKSFAIRPNSIGLIPFKELKELLLNALLVMSRAEVENDYLHRLLLLTGLDWQEIDVFRGYRNYYFQLGCPFTKKRVAFALINNANVALLLYRYFEGRFKPNVDWSDPMIRELEVLSPIRQQLVEALEEVSDTNEDRILRTLFNLIDSTVRTNFFIRKDRADYFFSFKISSLGVIDMPAPRLLYEVYVHSATMEGIHLRGGKVARGGIRWSDRPDDFRTEVLGLVKAQMTKNAVIVPVGSKGGFITKLSSPDREEMGEIVKNAYQSLMRGLLDLTDNRTGAGVVRPDGIVAYDDEDPYLVVAADKGTAHLPDTANAVSKSYGFWLGDAFASGGSHGYDHKKLGITARGAWESVKRLFRERGHNTQEEPFTVVGIGDMSGDVFGNGMLLSRKIKLLAAFNHMHIFLDPNPDPEASFKERERLFNLPRSTWDDYDKSLISEGGGVFSRTLKEIPLSPQVATWLGVRQKTIDVPGLIQLLLKAEVDLLWNGGIGTYVKATTETNENAGDRANDAVRVDATELRAKVVGEGGNLGMTQLARIEYAKCGGRLNTDAIDNSAGVDSSDHEVNLKILLQVLLQEKQLPDMDAGYKLLEEMEETVCQDVLNNNYMQTQSISLDEIRCRKDVEPYLELTDRLGRSGLLDRRDEYLPSRKDVAARAENSLLRPELSVLLAYSKMFLYRALLDSDAFDNRIVKQLLYDYFPEQAVDRYIDSISRHPLAKEITATMMTNRVIDQAGSAFCQTLSRLTGRSQVTVANYYLTYDYLLDGSKLRQAIYAMDNRIAADEQYRLLMRLEDTLFSFCSFALSNGMDLPENEQSLEAIHQKLQQYAHLLPQILPEESWQISQAEQERLIAENFSEDVALSFVTLDYLTDFLPLICMSQVSGVELEKLARMKVLVDKTLSLDAIINLLNKVQLRDAWDRRAKESLLGSLHSVMVRIVQQVALDSAEDPQQFFAQRRQKLKAFEGLRQSLSSEVPRNFHPFTVLLRSLDNFLAG